MGVDTDRDDRRIPGRHGVPQVREEAGSVVTGPSLDLDALREKAEKATPGPWRVAPGTLTRVDGRRAFVASTFFSVGALDQLYANAAYVAAVSPDVILAVLALVEEQRKALDRLLPYSDHLRTCAITGKRPPGVCTCGYLALLDALAGSPAENKEQT